MSINNFGCEFIKMVYLSIKMITQIHNYVNAYIVFIFYKKGFILTDI
jgi:hypothetical protein